eukprot:s1559_g8.t1
MNERLAEQFQTLLDPAGLVLIGGGPGGKGGQAGPAAGTMPAGGPAAPVSMPGGGGGPAAAAPAAGGPAFAVSMPGRGPAAAAPAPGGPAAPVSMPGGGWDWGRWLLILPWTKAAASIHARIIWRRPEARRARRPVDDTNDVDLVADSETDQASGSTAGAEAGRRPEARRARRPVDDTNDVDLVADSETDQASGSAVGAEAGVRKHGGRRGRPLEAQESSDEDMVKQILDKKRKKDSPIKYHSATAWKPAKRHKKKHKKKVVPVHDDILSSD